MIRLIGAALLTAGSAALGFGAVARLEGRVQDLRGLVAGLEVLSRELNWRMPPLPEVLDRAAAETKGRSAEFFALSARGARRLNGRAFRDVWLQAMEASQLRLEGPDAALLEQVGGVLGRYDGDSQCQALAAAAARLEEQRLQASEQRRRLGKVYGALGLTAGAFLVILLL